MISNMEIHRWLYNNKASSNLLQKHFSPIIFAINWGVMCEKWPWSCTTALRILDDVGSVDIYPSDREDLTWWEASDYS